MTDVKKLSADIIDTLRNLRAALAERTREREQLCDWQARAAKVLEDAKKDLMSAWLHGVCSHPPAIKEIDDLLAA